MKIRKGFVSNSSSSSFICDVCGTQESGWDACLSDFDMYECVQGHVFCADHSPLQDELDELEDHYEVNEKYCPICCMVEIPDSDVLKYIIKSKGLSLEKVMSEIRYNFPTYSNLMEYLQ